MSVLLLTWMLSMTWCWTISDLEIPTCVESDQEGQPWCLRPFLQSSVSCTLYPLHIISTIVCVALSHSTQCTDARCAKCHTAWHTSVSTSSLPAHLCKPHLCKPNLVSRFVFITCGLQSSFVTSEVEELERFEYDMMNPYFLQSSPVSSLPWILTLN